MNMDIFNLPETLITLTETENGPALWGELLKQMPGGIVAGGAVRDWFLGVPPKDIDVFFPVGSQPLFCPFDSVVGDKWDPGSDRAKEYEALSEIELVLRAEIGGFQIDAVFLNIPIPNIPMLLNLFDFSITRSAFDGYVIWDDITAQWDRQNKTVTRVLDSRPERAQARFDRFNERMGGGWEYVV